MHTTIINSRSLLHFLDKCLIPIFLVSATGKVIRYNSAFRLLFGYTKTELNEVFWPDYFVPNALKNKESSIFSSLVKRKKGQRYTTQIQKKNGTLIPVELCWNKFTSNVKLYPFWYSIVFDLSAIKRTEALLKATEDELKAAIHSSPIPQFIINVKHQVIYWNHALEQYSRINQNDIIGTTDHWKAFYKQARPCLADLLLDGTTIDTLSTWYKGVIKKSTLLDDAYDVVSFFPDLGDEGKWLYITSKVIFNSVGQVTGAIETLEDVSQQKRAEEKLQEAKEQVEVYLDLIGHDINNLNQICISNLEMLLKLAKFEENSKQLVLKSLDSLRDSSRLIDKVEKLKRINASQIELKRVDLGKTISEVCEKYFHRPEGNLIVKYQPIQGALVIANELLHEIFYNIIENAIKHSPKPCRLNIAANEIIRSRKRYYRVAIEDYGPGIPNEMKSRVFLKFQRGNTRCPGKGLGLYLIRALVKYYQGKVWVEDRIPGDYSQGSKFIVELLAAKHFP